MNSENNDTSDSRSRLLNLSHKIKKLKNSDKCVALSNLVYYKWKNKKSHTNEKFELFCIRHSRLFWVHHQKAEYSNW